MQTKNVLIIADDGASRRALIRKLVGIGYQVTAHSRDYLMNDEATHDSPKLLLVILHASDSVSTLAQLLEGAEKRYASVIFTGDKALGQGFLSAILGENHIFIPVDSSAKDFSLVLGTAALTAQSHHREQSLRKIHWAISAFGTITKTEVEPSKALKGILGALSAITQSRCAIRQAPKKQPFSLAPTNTDQLVAYALDQKGYWQLQGASKQHRNFSEDDVQIFMMAGAICSRLI